MCATMPGRVMAVDATGAVVEIEGRAVRAATRLHPDTRPGEWVMVAAATIVDRLSAPEAAEIRAALQATFHAADPKTPSRGGPDHDPPS